MHKVEDGLDVLTHLLTDSQMTMANQLKSEVENRISGKSMLRVVAEWKSVFRLASLVSIANLKWP